MHSPETPWALLIIPCVVTFFVTIAVAIFGVRWLLNWLLGPECSYKQHGGLNYMEEYKREARGWDDKGPVQ